MARGSGNGVGTSPAFRRRAGPPPVVVPGFRDLAATFAATSSMQASLNVVRNMSAVFGASSSMSAALDVQAGGGGGNPSTIVTSRTLVDWWRLDLGVTLNGTDVATVLGQVNGLTLSQASAGNQPAYSASGGPNGTAMMTGDGTDDWIVVGWNPPAPGTTPFLIWAVLRQETHTNTDVIWRGSAVTTLILTCLTTNGQVRMQNPTVCPTNGNLTAGNARRVEALYGNTIADRLKIGSSEVSGTACGNNDSTNFQLMASATGTVASNLSVMEVAIWTGGDITPTEQTNLDAYVTGRYGAGLV